MSLANELTPIPFSCVRGSAGISSIRFISAADVESLTFDTERRITSVSIKAGTQFYLIKFDEEQAYFSQSKTTQNNFPSVIQRIQFTEWGMENYVIQSIMTANFRCKFHAIVETSEGVFFYAGINLYRRMGTTWESIGLRPDTGSANTSEFNREGHQIEEGMVAKVNHYAPIFAGDVNLLPVTTEYIESSPDVTAPLIVDLTPEDDQTGVLPTTPIEMYFNEDIKKGSSGTISLFDFATDTLIKSWDVTSSTEIFISGHKVILTGAVLDYNTQYYIIVPLGAIEDASGNDFAGLTVKGDWDFTTRPSKLQLPPEVVISFPSPGTIGLFPYLPFVEIEWDQPITPVAGNLEIYDYDTDTLLFQVDVTTATAIGDDRLKFDTSLFPIQGETQYYILMDSGLVENSNSIPFAGTSDKDDISFTTSSGILPEALNLVLSVVEGGDPAEGKTARANWTYFDEQGDPIDLGATVEEMYSYPTLTDAQADTNGTLITSVSTGTQQFDHSIVLADIGKFIRAWVTPVNTVPETGIRTGSNILGPILQLAYSLSTSSLNFDLKLIFDGTINIDWGDGSSLQQETATEGEGLKTYNKTYISGNHTITVYSTPSVIKQIRQNGSSLLTLDISRLTALKSFLHLYDNTSLVMTDSDWPTANTGSITQLFAYNTGITHLNLSGFQSYNTNFDIRCYNLPSLISFTGPASAISTKSSFIHLFDNTSITDYDFSNFEGMGGRINIHGCTLLETCTMPSPVGGIDHTFTEMAFHECPALDGISLVGFNNPSGVITFYDNDVATFFTFKTGGAQSTNTATFDFRNNDAFNTALDITILVLTSLRVENNPLLPSCALGTSTQPMTQCKCINNDTMTTWDWSPLEKVGGSVSLSNHANLTTWTLNTTVHTTSISLFQVLNNDSLTGTANISAFEGINGKLHFIDNAVLTGITYPADTVNVTELQITGNTSVTSAQDMSGLRLSGLVNIRDLPSVTSWTAPTFAGSGVITSFTLILTGLTGGTTHDLSIFAFNLYLYIQDMGDNIVSLNGATGGATTALGTISLIDCLANYFDTSGWTITSSADILIHDNGFSQANHDQLWVDLDTALGTGTGTINTRGATDSDPNENASLSATGLAAVSQLTTDGWTCTHPA